MANDGSQSIAKMVDRLMAGDVSEWGLLLAHYRPQLLRTVAARIDDQLAVRIDAEDVIQEAYLAATRRLPEYLNHRTYPLFPWLRQISLDYLVEAYRHHYREIRSIGRERPMEVMLSGDSLAGLAAALIDPSQTPSGKAMARESNSVLKAALDRLRTPDREVILLRFVEQLSSRDTAEVLGITESHVRVRLLRAVQRLRRELGHLGEPP